MTALMLTVTSGHDISDRFVLKLLELREADHERSMYHGVIFNESGCNVARARNELVVDFLGTECEWAWFVDTDMVCPIETLPRLIKTAEITGHKIVGALCAMVEEERPVPNVFYDDPDGLFKSPLDPPSGVVQVAATGTGCLLIHRDVLEKMQAERGGSKYAWFGEDLTVDAKGEEHWPSEDTSFCLRATACGFTIAVNGDIPIGHHKGRRVWWPEDCRTPYYPSIDDLKAAM